ncbi:MAG: hypothetical protein MI746_01210 [Pseudomonadales bacterium]|nr:hypothetical protein [Pseudomonadales bacterium]
MKKPILLLSSLLTTALLATNTQAESLIDGTYKSAGDDNGNGQCTLIIKSLDESHKYGDEVFELESTGDGACEWSAIGMSKSYAITAGLVTNSGTAAFLKITFPFGPAGNRVDVISYDTDGSLRNEESFTKADASVLAGS